jgi:homoaconitase/3-isopropylmalate dehydratase large subunit
MNDDVLGSGERRFDLQSQLRGEEAGWLHALMSPVMAAAAAIEGRLLTYGKRRETGRVNGQR